ncbi:MAG: hypothetical protein H7834_13070 [Magnetococcus sp. YQC-9]
MTTAAFDTLESIELLKSSGVPKDQARGHVKMLASAIRQIELRVEELAEKRDKQSDERLASLSEKNERDVRARMDGLMTKQETDLKFKELEVEIIQWMFGVAAAQSALFIAMPMMFPKH